MPQLRRVLGVALALVGVLLAAPTAAEAATRTWDGDTDRNFFTAANWSASTAPTASDTVVFPDLAPNNSREDVTIDSDVVVAGMTFNSGFGGTISYSQNERIIVKGDLTLASGTTVTFGAPSRLVVTGSFSMAGGTFSHTSGTTFLTPLTTATPAHVFGSATFNNLVIGDAVAVTSGLVGHWKLDENATPAADNIGSNDLTWNGTVATSTQRMAPLLATNTRAYDMASGDYLEKTGVTTFQLTTWTLSAWFKDTGAWGTGNGGCGDGTGAGELVNVGNDYLLRVCSTASATVGVATVHVKRNSGGVYDVCTASNSFNMNDNTWHLLTATKTGNTLNLWFDGVKTACTTTGTQNSSGTVLRASRHTTSTSYDFKGRIDDIRIYNRVLTDAEILALWAGSAEAGGTVSHSSSGTVNVSGNLSLGGTTWSGSSAVNLGGSWVNSSGYYSGTGLVTLNGSGTTNTITSNGQRFNALTASGSGTWTLQDRLWVDGALTQSAGTIDTGSYTVHAGTLNKTAGTFTVGSGTVVIDSRSAQTVTSNTALNTLRLESTGETDLVGYWKFDAGVGTSVRDWSASGNTGTLGGTASYTSSSAGTGFDNANALTLDGSSTVMSASTTGMPNSGAAQTVAMWIYYTALPGAAKTLFESLDSSTYGYRFGIGGANTLQIYKAAAAGAGGLATVDISNTTTYPLSTWRHVAWTYDGTTHRIYIDGSEKNTSTTTLVAGNVSTVRVGARATGAEYFAGRIDDVRVYNTALSAGEVAALAAGRYSGHGGGATYTLGANTTVNATLAIDNATLATSTYTLSAAATDATKVATLGAGGLTIGAATATFSGGFTTSLGSTVTMNTAAGALKIGNGKTFTMDGTLDLSTAGLSRSIECASASGCFYGFTVGSSATATPTLNLDGVTISQLDSSGLNVNSVAGSSTTFTKFDNVTFSGGTGTYQMQISAAALTLYANGLSFDNTSKTNNLKLTDTSGAGNDVRVYIGGTCSPTTDCESLDEDDDTKLVDGSTNGSDGTPDDAGNDGSVVQWLYRSYTDTAGTPVGFPTQAFDWNTFAALKTYALFNNFDGSQGRLYARDTDGKAASGTYYWSSATANENYVGAPRFTQEGSNYYLWVVSSTGRVYKIQDSGSALTTVAGYPFRDGASATATSPLWLDSSNVYWSGRNGSGTRKIFNLPQTSTTLNGSSVDITSDITVVPAVQTTGGTTYLYGAVSGTVWRAPTGGGAATTVSVTDSAVSGRMSLIGNIVYFIESDGTAWALNSSDLSTNWSYQDTDGGRHPGGCTSANQCSSGGLFLQTLTGRVTYGDQDGHLYVVSKSGSGGTLLSGYPFRPGASTDVFTTPPLVSNGVIAIGTSGGKVFLVDQQNASSAPSLIRTYNFRSAVSTISYDRNSSVSGEYMITTADGRLFYVSRITDPTPAND